MSLIDGREEEVNPTRIHRRHFNYQHTSLRDAAMRDVWTLFEVVAVSDHNGNGKLRSEIELLVKFLGHDEKYILWWP